MALAEWQNRAGFARRPVRRGHRWVFGSDNFDRQAAIKRLRERSVMRSL
jgi:hypothetical protein